MIRFIVWSALGYASCVWDCSCSPEYVRWPSATAVFVLLLAMREPRYAVWGAGTCGLAMDAAQGGPLGPRVLAGVLIVTLAGHFQLGHIETRWFRVALSVFILSTMWLLAPELTPQRWVTTAGTITIWDQPLLYQAMSTTLVTLAIRSLTGSNTRQDEAHW